MVPLLAVDDDPNMLEGLSEVLELEGFSVLTAQTGTQAVAALASFAPAAALTDYQLPDCSGFELAGRLAKLRPGLPIVLVTGRTLSPQEKEEGRRAGISEYVTKPFNMPELAALLRALASKEK